MIPMWAIDEKAINAFKSVWRIQINLVNIAPHNAKGEIINIKFEE